MRAQKVICYVPIVLALASIPPSLVSGVGLLGAVLSLLVAGVIGALKSVKCAAISCAITTVNIFGLSVLTISTDLWTKEMLLFLGVPYVISFVGIAVGIFRNKMVSLN